MLRLPPLRDKRILAAAGLMALLALVLDQASKIWILQVLAAPPHSLPVMRYLSFDLVWNRGITFGLFSSHSEYMPMVWAALAAAMIAYLLGGLWQSRSRLAAVSSGMIIGGAIGNVIDRFRFGAVVDFIHVAYYPWVFNVADAAIVVGVGLLVLESLRRKRSD